MIIWIVEFLREGYKIRKIFGQKGNNCILWIDIVASSQKLGIISENKVLKKWSYQQTLCSYKLIFINEKENQKNSVDFRHRFGHFLTTMSVHKIK